MKANQYYPGFKSQNLRWYPEDLGGIFPMNDTDRYWYVDGDKSADGSGTSWGDAFTKIQSAVTAASAGDTIYVAARTITALATDPVSYAETIIIPNATSNLSIIGVSRGQTQGGLPQIKIGAGSTAMLEVKAPGCYIANLGFNGISSTGGGIKLSDDGGSTKSSFGTTIANCHFKNCVGSNALSAVTGGAIMLNGAPWQTLITGNRFFNNVADITVTSASNDDAKDTVITNNIFSSSSTTTAYTDCNIYMPAGGSTDCTGLIIDSNVFPEKPAVSSGVNAKFVVLTGYYGSMTNNFFATNAGTFKAAGSVALVPATVFLAGNYIEVTSSGGTATTGGMSRAS